MLGMSDLAITRRRRELVAWRPEGADEGSVEKDERCLFSGRDYGG